MKLLKDKIVIFILLVLLLQIYIMASRGSWNTTVIQKNARAENKNRFKLSENLFIESEHLFSKDKQIIGSATYFIPTNCFTADSLNISIFQIQENKRIPCKKVKTRIADLYQLEFDESGTIKEDSFLKTEKISICPGERIEITNWFEYPHKEAVAFVIAYFIKSTDNNITKGEAQLLKKRSFDINGKHHYDFIILLYPVLWVILALLVIIKLFQVAKIYFSF